MKIGVYDNEILESGLNLMENSLHLDTPKRIFVSEGFLFFIDELIFGAPATALYVVREKLILAKLSEELLK